MSNFAAAYQHESNAAWLNAVMRDVANHQRPSCITYGMDWDDDMVDDPNQESSADGDMYDAVEQQNEDVLSNRRSISLMTASGARATEFPSRMSSLNTSRSLSPAPREVPGNLATDVYHQVTLFPPRRSASASNRRRMPDGSSQVLVSPTSAFISTRRRSADMMSSGTRTLEDGTLTRMLSPPSLGGHSRRHGLGRAASQRAHQVHTPEPVPESPVPGTPAPPYEEKDSTLKDLPKATPLQRSTSTRSNPGRPRPISMMSGLSMVSEFSGFAPHPAVRPLEQRKVLGEAAGPSDEDDDTVYPTALPLALIIAGICLSVFIISLDRNIITTAIPEITAQFHSSDDIGWYGSGYLLTASAFQPLYGRIYMSFETKSSFLNALAVFEVGSLVCALAPSSVVLVIGRAIQGLGSAGILTGSFVVATHSVRLQKRPILFACVGILYAVGALCGPLIGGAFTDTIGWRWCFWLNLPVGLATFLTVFFCFKRRQPKPTTPSSDDTTTATAAAATRPSFRERVLRLDIIGNIILLAAATMLFLALQYSEQRYAWSSARCIGLICGFGVTTLIFIAWIIYRGEAALLPPSILKQRTVAASCGAAFFIYGTTLIHAYYLPIYFQAIKGTSAITSGVNMIPYMCANALFGLIAGVFVSNHGLFAPPAILGCAIATIGCGLLATLHPTTSTGTWIGYEILVSAGIGMAIQQGFSAVQTALPLEQVPIGTAAVVASQSIGGAIFVSVGNTVLQDQLLSQNSAHVIPGVNIRALIELGATNFRRYVDPEQLPKLIGLYNKSLQGVLIATVPLTGMALVCSCFMEFRSVKKRKVDGKEGETEKA